LKLLALDAALGPFSVALDLDGVVAAERSDGNDALEAGLGRIAGLLGRAGIALRDLDRIAVGVGPGSFTGLRIALSFAKALAFGAALPLVGISSYDVLTPPDAGDPCLTILSGRPGIICARLLADSKATFACGPDADVAARLVPLLAALGRATIAGPQDVLAGLDERLWGAVRRIAVDLPNPAIVVARLARERPPAPSPHSVAPDYGELPAVTLPKGGTKIAP
jgi:tRNA threonylcarbamoyladenosine biosynthesis protein TsaB